MLTGIRDVIAAIVWLKHMINTVSARLVDVNQTDDKSQWNRPYRIGRGCEGLRSVPYYEFWGDKGSSSRSQ